MPFARPTLTELRNQVAQDIAANLKGADALLRFNNVAILGIVQAGLAQLHYGFLDWIARMAVPFTAEAEYLEAWAGLKAVLRKPATAASGIATFPGTAGTQLPDQSSVVRSDGVAYLTNGAAVVGGGGTVAVTITALLGGAAGNAIAGTIVTLGQAIAGIQSGGSVTADLTGGADLETDDALRSRMLEVYQAPPQGGDQQDYVEWAKEVAGVTRAWCAPNGMGIGTVIVYAMLDLAEAAHNGFPQGSNGVAAGEPRDAAATGDQLAIANHIFLKQPVTALVYATAPVANPVAFTVKGIPVASRSGVLAALADVFLREGAPGGTVDLAHCWTAIAGVSGVDDFVIQAPLADIVSPTGNLPTVGTVTWT